MSKNKILSIYLARDERGEHPKFHDELELYGKLHVFYDTPIFNNSTGKWELSRQLGGEIPSYMFPDIKEKECRKFISFENDHENQLASLCEIFVAMKKMKEENEVNKNKGQTEVQME